MCDLITTLDDLKRRGGNLTEAPDIEASAGRTTWQMIGVSAQLECGLISERTRAGVKAAKRRGIKFGRKFNSPGSGSIMPANRSMTVGVAKTLPRSERCRTTL